MITVNVFAPDAIDAQLVSDHIGQYLSNTGFNDVTVDRTCAPHISEPSTQSEALQAIRKLNPGLFSMPVTVSPEVGQWGSVEYPDGPESD